VWRSTRVRDLLDSLYRGYLQGKPTSQHDTNAFEYLTLEKGELACAT